MLFTHLKRILRFGRLRFVAERCPVRVHTCGYRTEPQAAGYDCGATAACTGVPCLGLAWLSGIGSNHRFRCSRR
jgi:hypothetical protein